MQVSSESTSDRQKLLGDPKTRELLRRLIVGGKALVPEVGIDGRVHYLSAEEVIGDPHAAEAWVAQMVGSGILKKLSSKDLVTCPTHFRVDPLIQLECLKCKTRKLRKTSTCGQPAKPSRP